MNVSFKNKQPVSFSNLNLFFKGDLAARNILLTHDRKAKIADFGLSTRIYIQTSERKGAKKGTFPFRWAAYETILNGETIKEFSDVWSFGVLMWELFHLGSAIPYGEYILGCGVN